MIISTFQMDYFLTLFSTNAKMFSCKKICKLETHSNWCSSWYCVVFFVSLQRSIVSRIRLEQCCLKDSILTNVGKYLWGDGAKTDSPEFSPDRTIFDRSPKLLKLGTRKIERKIIFHRDNWLKFVFFDLRFIELKNHSFEFFSNLF